MFGLQRDIDDLEKALSFARSVRSEIGSPDNRLTLLSWSRGGWIGYALLNEETQKPEEQRQVRAFIPVDTFFKVDDPTIRSTMCSLEDAENSDIANGIYAQDSRILVQVGKLAQKHPDAISPILGPPYTNLQTSMTLGAATYQFGPSFAAYYHFVGGTFPNDDPWAIPDGFRYTKVSQWNDFLVSASPFEPNPMRSDTYTISCGNAQTPFDNHLGEITVPVLYIGAGGGFGTGGLYTLSLLGSKDVSSDIISFFPPDQAAFDFGHVDLFYADEAKKFVWSPIYRWLTDHDGERG